MKKKIVAIALVMGLGTTVAFAGNLGQRIFLVGKLSFKRIA